MALTYDISKCANWKDLNSTDEWPVTHAVIFRTLLIDIGEITEKNIDQVYRRSWIVDKVCGYALFENDPESKHCGQGCHITMDDLRKRIGLHTNVSTSTDASFFKRVREWLEGDADIAWRAEKEKETQQTTEVKV